MCVCVCESERGRERERVKRWTIISSRKREAQNSLEFSDANGSLKPSSKQQKEKERVKSVTSLFQHILG